MIYASQTYKLERFFGLEKAVDIILDAGFTGIDVSLFFEDLPFFADGYREAINSIKEKANKKGVPFVQAHAPFGDCSFTEKFVNPSMPRCFETCALLGIPHMVVHPVHHLPYYGNEKEIFNYNLAYYRKLAPLAKEYGVKIAIENMWTRNKNNGRIVDALLADPYQMCDFYDVLDDDESFTVCLDLGHVALCNREPWDAIRIIGDRIGCLHVHDVDYIADLHTLPGMGKINWDEVCRALADINYSGDITLEADSFLDGFSEQIRPAAVKFMADVARDIAEKVDKCKAEKR